MTDDGTPRWKERLWVGAVWGLGLFLVFNLLLGVAAIAEASPVGHTWANTIHFFAVLVAFGLYSTLLFVARF